MATVSEQIKSIFVNYVGFTVECAMDEELKEKFKADPKPYLNDRIGMKIPYDDNVKVLLDDSRWRWPMVLVKSDEGEFVIEEGRLAMGVKGKEYYQEIRDYIERQKAQSPQDAPQSSYDGLAGRQIPQEKAPVLTSRDLKNTIYVKSSQDFDQTRQYGYPEKVDTVIQDMQVEDIVVILPFMDAETDLLGVVEYNENSEIVLTTST